MSPRYEVRLAKPEGPVFDFELRSELPDGRAARYPIRLREEVADDQEAVTALLWRGYRQFREFIAKEV